MKRNNVTLVKMRVQKIVVERSINDWRIKDNNPPLTLRMK